MVPQYKAKFPLADFKSWVEANPNLLWQEPKGNWELARFLANGGTCIIYFNKQGTLYYQGKAAQHVEEFLLCQTPSANGS